MTDLAEALAIPIPTLMAWYQCGWVEVRKVEAAVPRRVVWAGVEVTRRLERQAGGRDNELPHPCPVKLTTPTRLRVGEACSD